MNKIVEILREFDINDVRKVEEAIDEQFKALSYLYSNISNKDLFPILVIANSLVSYQLSKPGELYWWNFAKYFSSLDLENKNLYSIFRDFLIKFNKRFFTNKLKRVVKFLKNRYLIESKLDYYYENMIELWNLISKIMNQSKDSKTIVFSIKMFGYAMRIKNKQFIPYPFEIPIPLDLRVKKVTKKLTKEDPLSFWFRVSKLVNIPCLHIDSLIWPKIDRNKLEYYKTALGENLISNLLRLRNIINPAA